MLCGRKCCGDPRGPMEGTSQRASARRRSCFFARLFVSTHALTQYPCVLSHVQVNWRSTAFRFKRCSASPQKPRCWTATWRTCPEGSCSASPSPSCARSRCAGSRRPPPSPLPPRCPGRPARGPPATPLSGLHCRSSHPHPAVWAAVARPRDTCGRPAPGSAPLAAECQQQHQLVVAQDWTAAAATDPHTRHTLLRPPNWSVPPQNSCKHPSKPVETPSDPPSSQPPEALLHNLKFLETPQTLTCTHVIPHNPL
jgi:hypothetical protein